MFSIFHYKNDYMGICINKNEIQLGDISYINKLKNIKLDDRDNLYILAFVKNTSLKLLENFCNIFNCFLNENKNLTISEIIKDDSRKFEIFEEKNKLNDYIGLLSELLVIYLCQEQEINITKYYQNLSNDRFDFCINNKYLEVKHISVDKTITISNRQIENLSSKDFLIGVYTLQCSRNGLNILDVYKRIKNLNDAQKNFIEEKIDSFNNELEYKIDVDKVDLRIIENKYLPQKLYDPKNIILEAKYKIFALQLNYDNNEFFNILRGVINEK